MRPYTIDIVQSRWLMGGVAALLLAFAPSRGALGAGRLNVLLVTVDTLRADRIGVYGYTRAHTPTLDGLARVGVRFADASAHAALTYPAHASILTGRYPGAFGLRLNGMHPLPGSATTIAERFAGAGYRTAAIVASAVLDQSYGLNQGFDLYDDELPTGEGASVALADVQRPADAVVDAALQWLGRADGGTQPWFLWVHLYDPHLPYAAPEKYRALAPGRPYDAEVAYADAAVGRLVGAIDRGSTAMVVTADHGESLGQHGEEDHGLFLYDATLKVPLIVVAPGLPPRVVHAQVRSVDVAPTLADLAGLAPMPDADGISTVALMRGTPPRDVPPSYGESWYPRLHFGWSELRSLRVGEWKYIAAPRPELYDLRVDPGETRNVVEEKSTVAARMAADVTRLAGTFSGSGTARPSAQPDAETVARLQALGYAGAFAPVTSTAGVEDPKAHIRQYTAYRRLFNQALTALDGGRPAAAVPLLKQIVKSNVRAFEAHLYLGNAYAALGRHEAALGEYDSSGQLNPDIAQPHFEAAKVLSMQRNARGAVARCLVGLAREPASYYGHYTLGVIHQKAGQYPEARAAFQHATALNGRDGRARAGLAAVLLRLGELDRAGQEFEAMIGLGYRVAPAQFNLGLIAARRGDTTEAARRYRAALAADAGFAPAREALDKLK